MNNLSRFRLDAFLRQEGRCHYCAVLMWIDDSLSFAREHGLSPRAARWLQCTAEHLLARRDGGPDSRDNIVAACLLCNSRRHAGARTAPPPEAYRKRVRQRVARGLWHFPQVLRCGLISPQEQ